MERRQKKQAFLYAGIGFVGVGIISIVAIYMFVYRPVATNERAEANQEFGLEEIHSVPLARHDHVMMSILLNGQPIQIPEGVGMLPNLWHDHSLDRYGPSGISPIHSHDTSGTIHIESTIPREYTVGEFLSVMGLDPATVRRMTVNGAEVDDFLHHAMQNGERIQLELTIVRQ
ncbi:MAG TPA: hypothetical protein VNI77_04890 [Nitrososphaera sp.]|nr:hypothetical protein [Nitrososphaera sp.]